jgi:hypothetical protein
VINDDLRHVRRGDSLGEALRGVLLAALECGPSAVSGIDSIHTRACAALSALLVEHSVDQWGRCRACRRSGALLGWRRRRCRVYSLASLWLLQPATFLHSHLAHGLGVSERPCQQATSRGSA